MLIHHDRLSGQRAFRAAYVVCVVLMFANLFGAPAAIAQPENGKTFQDWTIRCVDKEEESVARCYIFQSLVLREGGQRVLHVAVGYLPTEEHPVALFTLPLSISLPPGGSIQVDDNEEQRFQIERCEVNGCRAGISLKENMLEQFMKGMQARIIFHDGARRPISVPLSLKGFTAGLAALK